MRIPYTMDVACAPGTLWGFISEPEKQKLWMKGLVENVPNGDAPPGAFSSSTMRIREGGRVSEYALLVTRYEEPTRLTAEMRGKAFGDGVMVVDYLLTPLDGRTRLDYVCAFEAPRAGMLMRVLMRLGSLFAKRQLRGFMATLKALAEREGAGVGSGRMA